MKIDGRAISQEILDNLKTQTLTLKQKGITPTLAVILMGDNQSSEIYVKQKTLKAEEIGAKVDVYRFDNNVSNEEIETLVKKLNSDTAVHGLILQRPAPSQIKADALEELISPEKEVDGFGEKTFYPVPVAEAVWRMLLKVYAEQELQTKKIIVIGKGETAGTPIINHLRKKGTQLQIIDSQTENREELLKTADVIISAVGKENVFTKDDIKNDAVVIGVGLGTDDNGKLRGDFDQEEIEKVASAYSPTPGGVGPVNVAILMENLVKAATN